MTDPTPMPETFRARLDAALARPSLLDPGSVALVHSGLRFLGAESEAKGAAPFRREGDVAIVTIEGALAQRAWSCWGFGGDGYDAIEKRMRAAFDDPSVRAIVMLVDSPGGEVAGCFESARGMRAAATKPVVAYADEMCCSAAYALAMVADEIVVPDTGLIGSVGVITVVGDRVGANEADGKNLRVVRSGRHKATPHPDERLTDEAVARVQADIDALAQIFAGEVVGARRAFAGPDAVLALEGAAFLGAQAVQLGLADRVGNLRDAMARARALADRRLRRSSAAANTKAKNMETVAKALGLPPEASEADILIAVQATRADLATAEQTVAALTGDVAAANERAQAAEARADQVERAALMAEIKAARKWSASLDAFLAGQSMAQLRTWLETAPAVVPAPVEPPADPPTADAELPQEIAALAAKGWNALTAREKHRIADHDPDLAARLRRAAA
jgi:signal peptide peptidase SppA